MIYSKGAVEVIQELIKKGYTMEKITKTAMENKGYSDLLQMTIQYAAMVK